MKKIDSTYYQRAFNTLKMGMERSAGSFHPLRLKMLIVRFLMLLLLSAGGNSLLSAQSAPAEDENIPFLVTFGANSDKSWGDDDFCQIFFFMVPPSYTAPFYLRVFDPDTGGENDEMKGEFNTSFKFSIYGGAGSWSNPDARGVNPVGNFESGNLLGSRTFDKSSKYDDSWYTFGPFNQKEGEYIDSLGGYIFKMIARGISGDDGNLYQYFMSTERNENKPIEGANVFTYEYTFRLWNNQNNVSQIYPYLDDKVTSVKIFNYDWDNDGFIRVVSVAKQGELCTISGEKEWKENTFPITDRERNTSMEIQFIKSNTSAIRNNNVVIIVQNQYGMSLPFYVIPLGGRPVYNPALRMKAVGSK